MIIYAEPKHSREIRELWDIAFGEDKDFNEYFFDNIFDRKNVLLYIKDGKIAAMTQAIEYEIKGTGKFTYIYGAATHPNHRNKGIMTELLKKSFELDIKNGAVGSMLIPANKGLFDFYARLGYVPAFYISKKTYPAADADISEASEDDRYFLNEIYEASLSGCPHPTRSEEYWRRQINMFRALGGYVFKTETAYAFGWKGEHPEIQELMGANSDILAGAAAKKLGIPEITASLPGDDIPLGVIKMYDRPHSKMYFNLMYN